MSVDPWGNEFISNFHNKYRYVFTKQLTRKNYQWWKKKIGDIFLKKKFKIFFTWGKNIQIRVKDF